MVFKLRLCEVKMIEDSLEFQDFFVVLCERFKGCCKCFWS